MTHKQGGENLRKNKFGFGDLGLELLDAASASGASAGLIGEDAEGGFGCDGR